VKVFVLYITVSSIAIAISIFLAMQGTPTNKVINCGVAEISPDFTTEMRQACRKARMEKVQ
jgi:hypothetical protein